MKKLFLTITLLICFSSFGQTAKEYSNKGVDKFLSGDYSGSIIEYNKAIEINPNSTILTYLPYRNRAMAKHLINDHYGACQDANKAQELGFDATRMINIVCK